MIQRIQTLYLLVATVLMAIFFFSPLAVFTTTDDIYTLSVLGINSVDNSMILQTHYLSIIALLASLLPLVNIFLFNKRMLQLRLCVVHIVLALGALIVSGVYYYLANRTFGEDGTSSIRIVCVLPLLAMFFDYLALKGILKDELLIKSLDRIR